MPADPRPEHLDEARALSTRNCHACAHDGIEEGRHFCALRSLDAVNWLYGLLKANALDPVTSLPPVETEPCPGFVGRDTAPPPRGTDEARAEAEMDALKQAWQIVRNSPEADTLVKNIARALAQREADAVERAAKVCDEARDAYPTDIFPDPLPEPAPASREQVAGFMGRHLCRVLAQSIRSLTLPARSGGMEKP